MKIAIGADHGGFELKEGAKALLQSRGIEVEDIGCFDKSSVDYPDYALQVASRVSEGNADQGMLICTSGIGMSMAANKFPDIRAALCLTPRMAEMARAHNNANVLVLGGTVTAKKDLGPILDAWLKTDFEAVERHERRLAKIRQYADDACEAAAVRLADPEVYAAFQGEARRQRDFINLIASENYVSRAVREAQASIMTNKYAEGYPGKRWYNGCEWVDAVERIAVERAKTLFNAEHANVQPHCGSSANMAAYFTVLQPGDRILAMNLLHGGHLTHGHPANFSGRLFRVFSYGVDRATERINYDELARLARETKPRMIVAGASSYPRVIDFARLRQIADEVGTYLLVDMAHIVGLVAAGCHPSPVPHCDFVTSTTHKTLRGPRSGMILCREKYANDVDRQVFPGLQGGPLMHTIASKAVCLKEAMAPEFREYQRQVIRNAQALGRALGQAGLRIVSGGTDNHLVLADATSIGLTGKDAAEALEKAGIICNKNVIPFDTRGAAVTSGIRFGTPAVTTRGMKEGEMTRIGGLIGEALQNVGNAGPLEAVRRKVVELTASFPVP